MKRVPEPELMESEAQASAYDSADLSITHDRFIEQFRKTFPFFPSAGYVLDLGCGTADITRRFARAFPECKIDGIEGANEMIRYAELALANDLMVYRQIRLIKGIMPHIQPPRRRYQAIISNSLLHHLADPATLWSYVKSYGAIGSAIFIMDLRRPRSEGRLMNMVKLYGNYGSAFFQRDFTNSLRAAYQVSEVRTQLRQARLDNLNIRASGDRHLIVAGVIPQIPQSKFHQT